MPMHVLPAPNAMACWIATHLKLADIQPWRSWVSKWTAPVVTTVARYANRNANCFRA